MENEKKTQVIPSKEGEMQKRRRSGTDCANPSGTPSPPLKRRSLRRCNRDLQNNGNGNPKVSVDGSADSHKSVQKRLSDSKIEKPKWNLKDPVHMKSVKEALHVSMAPPAILCREEEQKRLLEFCKSCVEQEKAGSMYVCGCPGTGKTLAMERVKELLLGWADEERFQHPNILHINCTSLANTSEIFSKMLENCHLLKKTNGIRSPFQHLQDLFSQNKQTHKGKMIMIVVDEMDYLITRDRAVLHDLFMLTTLPFSRCILIGIANALDLADRFLPKLQSLNCKPQIITFRAYSTDQILSILQQRLATLAYDAFEPQALELCARKVAAVSGDMRRALSICRSAVEMLEIEIKNSLDSLSLFRLDKTTSTKQLAPANELFARKDVDIVRFDHMAVALSRAFKSPVVETIQSLPQHQQIIMCSAAKCFQQGKKEMTIAELNKAYSDTCKSASVPAVSMLEFSTMCRVLGDQGLVKLGQSREDRLRKVTLKIDNNDVVFALQYLNE
ncbi:hypothetical protein QJS04_geneDACA011449 [Acorus gramineus]|uniref:Cell division control protein n=1 Tax=Acorus gramineus TaxID=55184 RepID=A0AAV9AL48_ACOGR|nr:hypothetical protein QJS04_geneDACA011449 [Acorus gramineus]